MSLLMDALRKAEADKGQADTPPGAGSELASAAGTAPVKDTTQPASPKVSRASGPVESEQETRGRKPPPGESTAADNTGRWEDTEPGAREWAEGVDPGAGNTTTRDLVDLALEPLDEQDPHARDENLADTVDLATKHADGRLPGAPSDNTSTLPSARAVQSQLEDYFDHSQSVGFSRTATGTSRTVDQQAVEPIAGETVVTAQTVFAAGTGASSRRVLGISVAVVAILAVVLLAAGIFYFQQTPVTRTLPSPLTADVVEKPVPKELPIVLLGAPVKTDAAALTRLESAQPETVADNGPAPAAVEPVQTMAPVEETRPEASTADVGAYPAEPQDGRSPAKQPAVQPAPAVAEPQTPPPARVETPETFATVAAEPSVPPPEVGVGRGEVRIAHRPRPTKPDEQLASAYAAFVAGDFAKARQLYEQVLSTRPQQRDALLGMAAIALRNGQIEAAYRNYAAVVRRDPGNATANAALFMLEGGVGDQITEARLKLLLDQGADVAYIYFALGTLYVRQNRWADAQQAFFNAYNSDSGNADYSFNLAVSLDRMGKSKAALGYYQKALALADESGGSFNPTQVLERIHGLVAATDD